MEFDQRRLKCIYIIHMYGTNFYKIGVASNVAERVRMLQNGNPIYLKCIWHSCFCDAGLAYRVEHFIHDDFRDYRMSAPHQREWFRLTKGQVEQVQQTIMADLQSDRLQSA